MITEHISVSNTGAGMSEALGLADNFSKTLELDKKQSFHLRLLIEEMFNLIRAVAGNFSGQFWIEAENKGKMKDVKGFKIHLASGKSDLDYAKRRELLSVSTKGDNIASRGIVEKIRDMVEAGLYSVEESFNMQAEYGSTAIFSYGMLPSIDAGISDAVYSWSMQKYKDEIEAQHKENSEAEDAWDELEKSIIANIADDVKVGVRKGSFEIIIEKNFN